MASVLLGVFDINNYEKIRNIPPFELAGILARSCPTNEDMVSCNIDTYGGLDRKSICRRCWLEWLSRKAREPEDTPPEIIFGYDSVRKVNDDVSCWIDGD